MPIAVVCLPHVLEEADIEPLHCRIGISNIALARRFYFACETRCSSIIGNALLHFPACFLSTSSDADSTDMTNREARISPDQPETRDINKTRHQLAESTAVVEHHLRTAFASVQAAPGDPSARAKQYASVRRVH